MTWRTREKFTLQPFAAEFDGPGATLEVKAKGPIPPLDEGNPWRTLFEVFAKWRARGWEVIDTADLGEPAEGLALSRDLVYVDGMETEDGLDRLSVRGEPESPCFYVCDVEIDEAFAVWSRGGTVRFRRETHLTVATDAGDEPIALDELRSHWTEIKNDSDELKTAEGRAQWLENELYALHGAVEDAVDLDELQRELGKWDEGEWDETREEWGPTKPKLHGPGGVRVALDEAAYPVACEVCGALKGQPCFDAVWGRAGERRRESVHLQRAGRYGT